jgi:paraquat-inducible protein B
MSRRASPAIVGSFVLGGVALLVIAVLLLGSGELFRKAHNFVAYFHGSVAGLVTGADVKFKGVDVGVVRDVQISISDDPQHPEETRIPVIIEVDERKLKARGAIIKWDDPAMVGRLIEQGLRVQLVTKSYVTGVRYIALDMFPGSPATMANDRAAPYPELPVMSSGLEDVQKKLDDLFARLADIDIAGIVTAAGRALESVSEATHSVQHAAASIDALVSAPELMQTVRALRDASVSLNAAIQDFHQLEGELRRQGSEVGKNLNQASASAAKVLARAEAVLTSAQGVLSADAPVVRRVEQTLSDISDAARSFRRLADSLERDPGSVLRGGNR